MTTNKQEMNMINSIIRMPNNIKVIKTITTSNNNNSITMEKNNQIINNRNIMVKVINSQTINLNKLLEWIKKVNIVMERISNLLEHCQTYLGLVVIEEVVEEVEVVVEEVVDSEAEVVEEVVEDLEAEVEEEDSEEEVIVVDS